MPIVLTRLTRSISAAALMCVTVLSGAVAQSDAERRDTASVQQVYFRTLSTPASVSVVGDAQLALDLAIGAFGATAGRTADMALNLGRALNATQQFDAALSTLNSAKSIYEDLGADATLRAAVTDYEIGVALMGTGDMDGATKVLTEAYAMLAPTFAQLSADADYVRAALQMAGGPDAVAAARQIASARAAVSAPQPKTTLRVPPIYPPDAPDSEPGWVLLDYRVWPDGSVRDVFVLAGKPEGVFDISAAMALTLWRFEPSIDPTRHYQLNVAFRAN